MAATDSAGGGREGLNKRATGRLLEGEKTPHWKWLPGLTLSLLYTLYNTTHSLVRGSPVLYEASDGTRDRACPPASDGDDHDAEWSEGDGSQRTGGL
ncbi:Diphthine methyl ester synthase [Fusarium oxysporum f. sp. albedinis]|nr:Diphthine methyl ester synthase [Fusarium oxysporum f. sp. albedinis]